MSTFDLQSTCSKSTLETSIFGSDNGPAAVELDGEELASCVELYGSSPIPVGCTYRPCRLRLIEL